MSNLVLQAKTDDYKPHPEGIYPAVCVDVMDLGMVETEFQGKRKMVNKVRLYFETEYRWPEGNSGIVSKTFTASLHPKARLADFLGRWRGRSVAAGETIQLGKLIGACCTLVISQQENMVGRKYSSIDAVSKPTKKLVASGQYDPAAARKRMAEAKAREGGAAVNSATVRQGANPVGGAPVRQAARAPAPPAPVQPEPVAEQLDYDPDVGF